MPGSADVIYNMGKVRYLLGDFISSQTAANNCLKIDAGYIKVEIVSRL
jgi:hypothetical protein